MTNKLPEKLTALRKYFSFAQLDVASKIGVPVSEYMKWENGNSVCGIEDLKKIAKLYDVDVQDLFINDRTLQIPDVEEPYASVNIPFVEAGNDSSYDSSDELENHYDDLDDSYDVAEDTIEDFDEEELEKTRTIGTNTLQATTIMKIQEDPSSSKAQNAQKNKKTEKKLSSKTIGILAVSCVIVIGLVLFLVKQFVHKDELSLSLTNEKRLVAAEKYSAYVTSKGNLLTSGENDTFNDFTDIVQIDSDGENLIGLKKSGKLVSSGELPSSVAKWKNIISISMSKTHYAGVTKEGTVLCEGSNDACKVDNWTNISKIYSGEDYTIGISENGRVYVSGNISIKDTLESLSSVSSISQNDSEIAVLFTSGKVNCYALDSASATNTTGVWSNIAQVAVGKDFVAGITDKETVILASTNDELAKEVAKWAGIKYIAAYNNTLIAITSSDQIIGAGDNTYHQYNTLEEASPSPSASSSTLPALDTVQNIKFSSSSTGVTINWDSVLNANYYEVSVNTSPNEIKIKSAGNSASIGADKLTDGTTYKVTIVAYPKDTDKYAKSTEAVMDYTYSSPVKKLATPTNVKYTLNGKTFTFTWDAVENATSYTFAIGTYEQEVTGTSIDIDGSNMSNNSTDTAYISAKSNDEKFSESDAASIKFTYSAPSTPLATPTITSKNVNIDSGDLTITWQKDEHASNYNITVGNLSFTSDSGTLVIKADQLNSNTDYRIVITANPADSNLYSSSSYEENYKYDFTKKDTPPAESASPQE